MLYAFMAHHSHLACAQSIELSKSMAIFVFQYKAKQTSYACVERSHSVLVIEMKHFYLLNDASSIFSHLNCKTKHGSTVTSADCTFNP